MQVGCEGDSTRFVLAEGQSGEEVVHLQLADKELREVGGVPPARLVQGRAYPRQQEVTPKLFQLVAENVKTSLSTAAATILNEFHSRFPRDDIMESWAIVYPHYWDKQPTIEQALDVLETTMSVFCAEDELGDDIDIESPDSRPKSKPLLNRDVLLRQFGTFHTLATEVAKRLPTEWHVVDSDEKVVDTHLNLCMRMYLQNWWSVADFPYSEALEIWHKNSGPRGRYGRPTAI